MGFIWLLYSTERGEHVLSLMCDDLNPTMAELCAKGLDVATPRHPVAIDK